MSVNNLINRNNDCKIILEKLTEQGNTTSEAYAELARIAGLSVETVRKYFAQEGAKRYTKVPEPVYRLWAMAILKRSEL